MEKPNNEHFELSDIITEYDRRLLQQVALAREDVLHELEIQIQVRVFFFNFIILNVFFFLNLLTIYLNAEILHKFHHFR